MNKYQLMRKYGLDELQAWILEELFKNRIGILRVSYLVYSIWGKIALLRLLIAIILFTGALYSIIQYDFCYIKSEVEEGEEQNLRLFDD